MVERAGRHRWAIAVVLLVAAAGVYVLTRPSSKPQLPNPDSEPASAAAGFSDAAAHSGIGFRMSFLPNEQGENYVEFCRRLLACNRDLMVNDEHDEWEHRLTCGSSESRKHRISRSGLC